MKSYLFQKIFNLSIVVSILAIAFLGFGINRSVIAQDNEAALADKSVVVPPVPKLPTGTISDTTPTYKWTSIAGAKKYSFTLNKGATIIYTKEVLATACGSVAAYCSTTPATVLADGIYSWKVKAYVNSKRSEEAHV